MLASALSGLRLKRFLFRIKVAIPHTEVNDAQLDLLPLALFMLASALSELRLERFLFQIQGLLGSKFDLSKNLTTSHRDGLVRPAKQHRRS